MDRINKKIKYFVEMVWGEFPGSRNYWEVRYGTGGDSGAGSYGELAEFKAEIINNFVEDNDIKSVIEFGCGDGNQLRKVDYTSYIGLDVSKSAIKMCKEEFFEDETKSFFLYNPDCFVDKQEIFKSELGLSLDVIYHLVEDEVFEKHMKHLFRSSEKYVIIYSSNTDEKTSADHINRRKFTDYIEENFSEWSLEEKIQNRYPENSNADFFIYENYG